MSRPRCSGWRFSARYTRELLCDLSGEGVDRRPIPEIALGGVYRLHHCALAELEQLLVEAAGEDTVVTGLERPRQLIDIDGIAFGWSCSGGPSGPELKTLEPPVDDPLKRAVADLNRARRRTP